MIKNEIIIQNSAVNPKYQIEIDNVSGFICENIVITRNVNNKSYYRLKGVTKLDEKCSGKPFYFRKWSVVRVFKNGKVFLEGFLDLGIEDVAIKEFNNNADLLILDWKQYLFFTTSYGQTVNKLSEFLIFFKSRYLLPSGMDLKLAPSININEEKKINFDLKKPWQALDIVGKLYEFCWVLRDNKILYLFKWDRKTGMESSEVMILKNNNKLYKKESGEEILPNKILSIDWNHNQEYYNQIRFLITVKDEIYDFEFRNEAAIIKNSNLDKKFDGIVEKLFNVENSYVPKVDELAEVAYKYFNQFSENPSTLILRFQDKLPTVKFYKNHQSTDVVGEREIREGDRLNFEFEIDTVSYLNGGYFVKSIEEHILYAGDDDCEVKEYVVITDHNFNGFQAINYYDERFKNKDISNVPIIISENNFYDITLTTGSLIGMVDGNTDIISTEFVDNRSNLTDIFTQDDIINYPLATSGLQNNRFKQFIAFGDKCLPTWEKLILNVIDNEGNITLVDHDSSLGTVGRYNKDRGKILTFRKEQLQLIIGYWLKISLSDSSNIIPVDSNYIPDSSFIDPTLENVDKVWSSSNWLSFLFNEWVLPTTGEVWRFNKKIEFRLIFELLNPLNDKIIKIISTRLYYEQFIINNLKYSEEGLNINYDCTVDKLPTDVKSFIVNNNYLLKNITLGIVCDIDGKNNYKIMHILTKTTRSFPILKLKDRIIWKILFKFNDYYKFKLSFLYNMMKTTDIYDISGAGFIPIRQLKVTLRPIMIGPIYDISVVKSNGRLPNSWVYNRGWVPKSWMPGNNKRDPRNIATWFVIGNEGRQDNPPAIPQYWTSESSISTKPCPENPEPSLNK